MKKRRPSRVATERQGQARVLGIVRYLLAGYAATSATVMEAFGVSHATAKRDLRLIRKELPVSTAYARDRSAEIFLRVSPIGRPGDNIELLNPREAPCRTK